MFLIRWVTDGDISGYRLTDEPFAVRHLMVGFSLKPSAMLGNYRGWMWLLPIISLPEDQPSDISWSPENRL